MPPCVDELLQELGSEELFRRVLAIGYMSWQGFEKNRRKRLGEKYKPNAIHEVAAKFDISTSRLMDLRRGAAINREDTQCSKMLKAEKKEEEEDKTLPDHVQLHQRNKVLHNRPPPGSEKTPNKNQNLGPFRDHQIFPK